MPRLFFVAAGLWDYSVFCRAAMQAREEALYYDTNQSVGLLEAQTVDTAEQKIAETKA